ncbi:MAG: M3 family oligoendopeptidase [Alphaproteobacteria bacterium]|nr:M3 family oligoendopeptidase [Alphaproteobacteria bacterium]
MNATAPDWDLSAWFEDVGTPDYRAFVDRLTADLASLPSRLGAAEGTDALAGVLGDVEDAQARLWHLSAFLSCRRSADGRDEAVQRAEGERARLAAASTKVTVALQDALAGLDAAAFETLCAHPSLQDADHALRRTRDRARHAMPAALEDLAADLGVDGLHAWGRLYSRLTSELEFELRVPGAAPRTLPVSMARTTMEDADPAVRRAALAGANAAWARHGTTLAGCLNGIAGTRLALAARRGWDGVLDEALVDAGIERRTLDALWTAVRAHQDLPRRFLHAKARRLGLERLGFQDVGAPLPVDGEARLAWAEGHAKVRAAFRGAYPALADFADEAVARRWIDHAPRAGKSPGAFCTSSPVIEESRVFLTFHGAAGDVQTLAHELGHAFHNRVLRGLRPWARRYPMTLAETASTFAEQVVLEATLDDAATPADLRLALRDHRLTDAAVFLLNIPMRFDVEQGLYTRRRDGELSVRELCDLTRAAQLEHFGDALDPGQLDPWFWASKLHFYLTNIAFYNFPYTFGFLFSTAIYARWKAEGDAFLATYERLLRATGTGTAEQVARDTLGVDLGDPDFWAQAIRSLEPDLEAYTRG